MGKLPDDTSSAGRRDTRATAPTTSGTALEECKVAGDDCPEGELGACEWWQLQLPEFALRQRFKSLVDLQLRRRSRRLSGREAQIHEKMEDEEEEDDASPLQSSGEMEVVKPLSTSPREMWRAYREAGAPLPLSNEELLKRGFSVEVVNRARSRLDIPQWARLHKSHCRLCASHKGKRISQRCYFAELLCCLRRGFTLPFVDEAALPRGIHAPPILPRSPEDDALLKDRKKEDLWQARIPLEATPFTREDVFSAPSFVARKRVFQHLDYKEPRVVTCFNMTVNPFLKVPPYQLVNVADIIGELGPSDQMGILDLSSAFLQLPMAPEVWRFLGVQVDHADPSRIELYTKLPFGLSVAPIIFNVVSAEVMSICRGSGLRVWSYFDDFPIITRTSTASKEFDRFKAIVVMLGLAFKEEKLFYPADRAVVLGMEIDIPGGTMTLKKDYIKTLGEILNEAATTAPTLSELRSIVGRLNHAAAVLPAGRLRLNGLYDALQVARNIVERRLRKGKKLAGLGTATGGVRIFPLLGSRSPKSTKEDLSWWINACKTIKGSQWKTRLHCANSLHSVDIRSDASLDHSAAALCNGTVYLAGRQHWSELFGSSTDAELLGALLPLLVHPHRFRDSKVTCWCDNAGACYLLNSLRGRRGPCNALLKHVMDLQIEYRFIVLAKWIPRETNEAADSWSRVDCLTTSTARGVMSVDNALISLIL